MELPSPPALPAEPSPAGPAPPAPGLWEAWSPLRMLAWAATCLVGNAVAQSAVFALSGEMFLAVAAGGLLGMVAPTLIVCRLTGSSPARDFALGPVAPAILGWAAVAAAASIVPTALLADLSARLCPVPAAWERMFASHLPRTPGATIGAYAAVVLAAPLAEELVFRGMLQRLAADRWGDSAGVVLAALLFGILHLEPWYLFGLIGVGLVLGYIRAVTRSLTACVVAHGIHNAAALTLMLRQDPAVAAGGAGTGDLLLVGASLPLLALACRQLARAGRRDPRAAAPA